MVSSGMSKIGKLGSVIIKGYLWEQYNKMENSGSGTAICGSGIAKWEPVGVVHILTVKGKLVSPKRTLTFFTFLTVYMLPAFLSFHYHLLYTAPVCSFSDGSSLYH
jgi:hypothetical protein